MLLRLPAYDHLVAFFQLRLPPSGPARLYRARSRRHCRLKSSAQTIQVEKVSQAATHSAALIDSQPPARPLSSRPPSKSAFAILHYSHPIHPSTVATSRPSSLPHLEPHFTVYIPTKLSINSDFEKASRIDHRSIAFANLATDEIALQSQQALIRRAPSASVG